MIRYSVVCLVLTFFTAAFAEDWPQWRGPATNGHAAVDATAPVQWNEDSGLSWNTKIPGRGNSSPTLVGDRIYLTTGDENAKTQSLLILDRNSGKLLKQVTAHEGKLPTNITGKNSHANSLSPLMAIEFSPCF